MRQGLGGQRTLGRSSVAKAVVVIIFITSGLARAQQAAPAAGMRIDIDPTTGELTGPPSGASNAGGATHATNAAPAPASEGLQAVPGPGPEYGMMVDLQGRFQSATRIDVAPSGQAAVHCETSANKASVAGPQP
jgi:hypothetical protein